MSLAAGTRIGIYEIVAPLGRGGMGEVYRARDPRLRRDVAIKLLPALAAADPDRRSRFQREAQVLAALKHPNIGAIYGLEEIGSTQALVLELVEGSTLADRLSRGRLPLDDALTIARQIAEGLDAAHERGIIHRDLKPANVVIATDGTVKVLDFGLAKVLEANANAGPGNAATVTATREGTILGTASYMSPEQATGKEADRATDVWAFGCVLYEMLSGHRAFDGGSASEIIADVLKTEPDWRRVPDDTPDSIRRLLRRSLEKDHRLRLRDIRDARLEIDDALRRDRQVNAVGPRSPGNERWAWAAIVAVLGLIAAGLGARAFRPAVRAPEVRFEIRTPATRDTALALSPDGERIVFVSTSGGISRLWLYPLASASPTALPGTERASAPFWSSNSQSIGFFADNALKRIDLDDGSVRTLATPAPSPLGGAWVDDTILVSLNPGAPIMRVPSSGGEQVAATRLVTPDHSRHSLPSFLRDNRHFLYYVGGTPEARGVYLGELGTLETRRLFDADTAAVQTQSGALLFVRQGTLWAQDFDMQRLEPIGDPVTIDATVSTPTELTASAAGPIAYRSAPVDGGLRQFVRLDRSGRVLERVEYRDPSNLAPAQSPDGKHLAVYRFAEGNMDIWSYGTEHGTWDRVTFDAGDDINPIWSPDGTELVFGSRRAGRMDIFRRRLNGPTALDELLLSTPYAKFPMDWSRDGRFLLFTVPGASRGLDIWALPIDRPTEPFALVQTDFNETQPQVSPNGKWFAYQSDRTGRHEIYLRPFPGPGSDVPVSPQGGVQPRWHPNGTEMFYVDPGARFMSVAIRFSADGTSVQLERPRDLFAGAIDPLEGPRQQYVVSPDGATFVVNTVAGPAVESPIKVILNWKRPGQ